MKRFSRLFKSKKGTSSSKKNELLEDEKPKENPAEPMPKRKSILKNSDKNSNSDVGPKDSDENTSTMTSPHSKKTRFQETCSSSEQWRKDGNKLYASATVDLCASVRDERLKKAIQCYYKAIQLADGKQEFASACKNYAMASWKSGDLNKTRGTTSMMHHHYKEAVRHFVKAEEAGRSVKSLEWNQEVGSKLEECLRSSMEAATSQVYDTKKKMLLIDGFRNLLSEDHKMLPDIYLFMSEVIFRGAVVAVSGGQFKEALSLLRDANFPMEEGKRFARDRVDVLDELKILEQDVFYQTCAAESLQACALGDSLLKRAVQDQETLNVDMIWEVIDWYKQAIVLTREKEVELEAIALSKLGSVYHKVLKVQYRAKDNYMRCVQLALSLHPRTFDQDEWFKEAKKTLEEYQAKTRREEDAKYQKERAKYLEELKDELQKLNKHDKDDSDLEFLQFVYATWPPKKKDCTMEDPKKIKESGEWKKALQKAVIHYHPDKVDVEEHGMKWKVLCEEIEKILTKKYELYK